MRQTKPLSPPTVMPWSTSLCRLLPVPAGRWSFPTLSLQIFPWMPGPLPRRIIEVPVPVSSLNNIGLPRMATGSAFPRVPLKRLLERARFRSCSHSLMFRPPVLLASLTVPTVMVNPASSFDPADSRLVPSFGPGQFIVVPTTFTCPSGNGGFYIRAEHMSLPNTCIE